MLKVNGVSFQGVNTQAVPNNVTAPQNEVQSAKKMSKTAKVAIGTSLLALAAVGVYVVTKNKKAAEALAKEAKSFGFEDVELFKQLKQSGIEIEKVENANYRDILTDALGVIKRTTNEKGERIANISLLSKAKTVEMLESIGIKGTLPENSFARCIDYSQKDINPNCKIFVYNKMDESLPNVCGEAWKNGKVYVQPVNN